LSRSKITRALALILLGLIIATTIAFTMVPSTLVYRILLAVTVVAVCGTSVRALISVQYFFQERREASKRQLAELRIHRAETKLLQRAMANLDEDARKALQSADRSIRTLQNRLDKTQKQLTAIQRKQDANEQVSKSINAEIQLFQPELERISTGFSVNFEHFSKNFNDELQAVSSELQKSLHEQVNAHTEKRLREALVRLEKHQTGLSEELLDHLSVKSKQLISILEAQRASQNMMVNARNQLEPPSTVSVQQIDRKFSKVSDTVQKMLWNETRQIESIAQLFSRHPLRSVMPPSGRWAMDARSLLHLLEIVRTIKPHNIVELGSGTSTVWLGYEAEAHGLQVTSIDHLEEFAAQTRNYLSKHALATSTKVYTMPLSEIQTEEDKRSWYDLDRSKLPPTIDLLLVDGPPGSVGRYSRFPAVPELSDRLSPNATIILDDSTRPDEEEILKSWLISLPGYTRVDQALSRLGVLMPQQDATQYFGTRAVK